MVQCGHTPESVWEDRGLLVLGVSVSFPVKGQRGRRERKSEINRETFANVSCHSCHLKWPALRRRLGDLAPLAGLLGSTSFLCPTRTLCSLEKQQAGVAGWLPLGLFYPEKMSPKALTSGELVFCQNLLSPCPGLGDMQSVLHSLPVRVNCHPREAKSCAQVHKVCKRRSSTYTRLPY